MAIALPQTPMFAGIKSLSYDIATPIPQIAADSAARLDTIIGKIFSDIWPTVAQNGFSAGTDGTDGFEAVRTIARIESPRILIPGELNEAPPLITAEGVAPPPFGIEVPTTVSPRLGVAHVAYSETLQNLSAMNPNGIAQIGFAAGTHLASAVWETIIDALQAISFTSGQVDAGAVSAANLQSALNKYMALRTANNALPPAPGIILMNHATAPLFYAAFPNGLPTIKLVLSKFVSAGRYFILPADVVRSPILISALPTVNFEYPGVTTDATTTVRANLYCSLAASPSFRFASDGLSARWCIRGGP